MLQHSLNAPTLTALPTCIGLSTRTRQLLCCCHPPALAAHLPCSTPQIHTLKTAATAVTHGTPLTWHRVVVTEWMTSWTSCNGCCFMVLTCGWKPGRCSWMFGSCSKHACLQSSTSHSSAPQRALRLSPSKMCSSEGVNSRSTCGIIQTPISMPMYKAAGLTTCAIVHAGLCLGTVSIVPLYSTTELLELGHNMQHCNQLAAVHRSCPPLCSPKMRSSVSKLTLPCTLS